MRKRNQHFKLLFFKLNSHLGLSIYTYIKKIKFIWDNQYLFGPLCSLKQRKLVQTKVHFKFLSESKRLTNLGSCKKNKKQNKNKKKILQCVSYRCNLLRWMFLFHVITGRRYFFLKVCRYFGIISTPFSCFLWNKCFERSPYFTLSPQ